MREIDRWRRVSRGLCWITFGTFLLLTTLGVLRWSYWWTLLPYWPVLLVMLGIRLIFSHSRARALVLLSPALLIGTMTLVAVYEPWKPAGAVHPLEVSRPEGSLGWRLEGEMAMVELNLTARELPADRLIEGEAIGGRDVPSVRVSGEERFPRVRIRNLRPRRLLPFQGAWWGEVRAGVAQELPVVLDLSGAALEGRVDLSAGLLDRLHLQGAFHDLVILLPPPEEETRIDLDGAFNRLELVVPEDTPVRFTRDGLLNFVDRRPHSSRLAGPAYRLDVEGLLNWVEVSASPGS